MQHGRSVGLRWLFGVLVAAGLLACQTTFPTSETPPARAVQPPVPSPTSHAGQYTLAILPWSITGNHEDMYVAEPRAKAALESALAGSAFMPTHSYYTMEKYAVARLHAQDFPALRRVWRGAGPPQVEVIAQLGAELGVAAVLVYDLDVRTGTDYVRVYLVDIARKQLHTVEAETYEFAESAYGTLLAMTQQVFAAYLREHVQPNTP